MAIGPGKYDEECTYVREATNADAVIVIVLGGLKGSGFSVQTTTPALTKRLPEVLRYIANGIDEDV
jgi:hypothetical protein